MPALTALTGESLASVAPESLDDTASSVDASPRRSTKRKKYGFGKRFAYQRLKGWRPTLSARTAEAFFLACGTLLLALGIPILVASLNIREYSARYDNVGPMANLDKTARQELLWSSGDNGLSYSVDIQVKDRMEPPIYIIYELGTFYQNYRRYVRSFDPDQMKDGSSVPGVEACLPYKFENFDENPDLPENGAILPCGQIAHSNFNDTYALSLQNGTPLPIDDSEIAWSADREHLYGNVAPINYNQIPATRGGDTSRVPLNENQNWMVWMRPGAKVPVQKLYGKITTEIPAGSTVTVTVNNRYNTYGFDGAKRVILTTNSWVGGRNLFLPIVYLVVAGLCYAAALAFFLGYDVGMVKKRQMGAEDDFSWVHNEASGTTTTTATTTNATRSRAVPEKGVVADGETTPSTTTTAL